MTEEERQLLASLAEITAQALRETLKTQAALIATQRAVAELLPGFEKTFVRRRADSEHSPTNDHMRAELSELDRIVQSLKAPKPRK